MAAGSASSDIAAGARPLSVALRPFAGIASIEPQWRRLEAEADGSFFTSWTWIRTALELMEPEPLELRVARGDELTGLALLWPEGAPRRLRLNLGAGARYASVFPEYNAILMRRSEADATSSVLSALRAEGVRSLRIDGAAPGLVAEARAAGWLASLRARQPHFEVDLAGLRAGQGDFLASLSRNARQQIRRSLRAADRLGGLELEAASDVGEALRWFADLERLHTQSWSDRGRPGAFAEPFFRKFNQRLIMTAFGTGEVELVRVQIGGRTAGYLYDFIYRQRVLYYQSGFDYKQFPGVQCGLAAHCLNIERHLRAGADAYDFMAGAQRYKASLGRAAGELVWFVLLAPSWQNRLTERLRTAKAMWSGAARRESASAFVL